MLLPVVMLCMSLPGHACTSQQWRRTASASLHSKMMSGRQRLSIQLCSQASQAAANCHHDAVLDLATINSGSRLLLSCSRDGIIKAWK